MYKPIFKNFAFFMNLFLKSIYSLLEYNHNWYIFWFNLNKIYNLEKLFYLKINLNNFN